MALIGLWVPTSITDWRSRGEACCGRGSRRAKDINNARFIANQQALIEESRKLWIEGYETGTASAAAHEGMISLDFPPALADQQIALS